ncbi:hypothetical protein AZE42_10804 [Rhizopogon vesiculosus]|uniref:Sodium/calcium exchanger membrane region domain-containing protein n=1 Tax=Rhizopogon vesiculosus TaxID=180088 RepID=A0A1J8QBU0_9AGAM|nr:hypothetical protein AZE42_10804 [Rhizopogon vesiculosus]
MALQGEAQYDEMTVDDKMLKTSHGVSELCVVMQSFAVTAEFLVDSIDGLTATGSISKEFVGVILLPIAGNAVEHVTAVTSPVKDKRTLRLSVAFDSSMQIALFVIQKIVITVNYVVQGGKSNWLECMILMCMFLLHLLCDPHSNDFVGLYLIVAITFWYYPGTSLVNTTSPSPRRPCCSRQVPKGSSSNC